MGRTIQYNLQPGQLVLVGDSEDLSCRGAYRLGHVEKLHPRIRKAKEIVRQAPMAVLSKKLGKHDPNIEYTSEYNKYGTKIA